MNKPPPPPAEEPGNDPAETRDLSAESPTANSEIQVGLDVRPWKAQTVFKASFASGSPMEVASTLTMFTLATAVPALLFAGLCVFLDLPTVVIAVVLVTTWLISMGTWLALQRRADGKA